MSRESFYVQSIGGYGGEEQYNRNAPLFKQAGFIRLRSEKDEEGKHWEIWYLPGVWKAEGPLEGKSYKEIKEWVFSLSPGTVEVEAKTYGLCVD
jgi:hypothetical protein